MKKPKIRGVYSRGIKKKGAFNQSITVRDAELRIHRLIENKNAMITCKQEQIMAVIEKSSRIKGSIINQIIEWSTIIFKSIEVTFQDRL